MIMLAGTVLLASLLGSLHCAGMCGAFVVYAVNPGERGGARRSTALQAAYHGGRLVTYMLLGAVAGGIGSALDLGGAFFGLQRAALMIAGASMIVFGLVTLLRLRGVRVGRFQPPAWMTNTFVNLQRRLQERNPLTRALGIGLFSTLLPCGWLYAFAVTAAGTGSVPMGAATMGLFWVGTLPVLIGIGIGVQKLAGPMRRHAPVVAAIALMIVGLVAVTGRLRVPPLSTPDSAPSSVEELAERVRAIGSGETPHCGAAE